MPLTDLQRSALPALRARFNNAPFDSTGESVEQRSRLPTPESLPSDVSVHVEIDPPSSHPDPTLQRTGVLKAPERVPVFFFTLNNDETKINSGSGENAVDLEEVANTRVIFFIHGGGNVTGHPSLDLFSQYYVQLLRAVASHSEDARKCVLIAPSYRLATVPENVFPAALQDLVAAYDYVVGKGYDPSNIVIAGDSAGGNHAIVLTHLILESGKLRPKGVVAIAPMSIQTNDSLSDYAKTVIDRDIVDIRVSEGASSTYVGDSGVVRTDPLVSGAFLPFTSVWPKTLILVGTCDILIDAARELAKRLAAVGRLVELVEYDERPHGWWVLPMLFSEDILDSSERIAQFILN